MDYKQTSGYGEINFYNRNQIGASDTFPLALTIRNEDITVQGDVNSQYLMFAQKKTL